MTKDRVFVYARKLQGMVKRAREIEGNIDDGEGYKALIADVDPPKALQLGKQLSEQRKLLEQLMPAVNKESKREGLAAAEELLTDITSALGIAEQLYDAWRVARQQYELECRLDNLDVEGIKDWNERLTKMKTQYETAVEQASDLVPSPGVIQL